MVKKKLERPILRALVRLAVVMVFVAGAAFLYVMVRIAKTKDILSYRVADMDTDGIPNYRDDDVDSDGLLNIEDNDANGNGTENWEEAVDAAMDLEGTRTDYLKGTFGNLGVRMGFARSATVALLAYERAGVYLSLEIARDAQHNRDAYSRVMRSGQVDVHDARALRTYAERQGWLVRPWFGAQIGDVLFFRNDHVGIVVDISDENVYEVVWADPDRQVVTRCPVSGVEAQGYRPTDYAAIGD